DRKPWDIGGRADCIGACRQEQENCERDLHGLSFLWLDLFQSMMTLDRAYATEEFLTFVSGFCRPSGQSWAVYFPTRGSRTSAGSTILNRLPLPSSVSSSIRRSLRRPTAPSRGQAPFLPILSSALAQHGRSARKFARDAPKECPTLYPRPRSRAPRQTSLSAPRESSLGGAC